MGRGTGCTAIELRPAAGPHWQALNLNLNRNLARLRFLEIKSKITIKIGKKPFRLNSMAVGRGWGKGALHGSPASPQVRAVRPTLFASELRGDAPRWDSDAQIRLDCLRSE